MGYNTIIVRKEEYVATLVMNRPERLNAITFEMFQELKQALAELNADEDVRVVVFTGAGRGFCVGHDIKAETNTGAKALLEDRSVEESRQRIRHNSQQVSLGLRNLEKPVIAMVNGPAVADGFDWTLACDLRVGSENARFMNAFVKMALVPNTGITWLLPRIVGLGKALEILYTGEWLEAAEAYRIGILNRLVPAADLERETMTLARKLAKGPPISLRIMKMHAWRGLEMGFDASLELAADGESMTLKTQDHQEAVAAFIEKREAVFKGK